MYVSSLRPLPSPAGPATGNSMAMGSSEAYNDLLQSSIYHIAPHNVLLRSSSGRSSEPISWLKGKMKVRGGDEWRVPDAPKNLYITSHKALEHCCIFKCFLPACCFASDPVLYIQKDADDASKPATTFYYDHAVSLKCFLFESYEVQSHTP